MRICPPPLHHNLHPSLPPSLPPSLGVLATPRGKIISVLPRADRVGRMMKVGRDGGEGGIEGGKEDGTE